MAEPAHKIDENAPANDTAAAAPEVLDVAARQRWEAMACGQCHAFAPMSAAQWREEVPQLAALGRVLARVIRTAEPRLGARGGRTE